jgi:hypothetical protein
MVSPANISSHQNDGSDYKIYIYIYTHTHTHIYIYKPETDGTQPNKLTHSSQFLLNISNNVNTHKDQFDSSHTNKSLCKTCAFSAFSHTVTMIFF